MANHGKTETNLHKDDSRKGLGIALTITIVIMAVELAGGILSHSLALTSDAGRMLVDALALVLSIVALNLAKKPGTSTRTYGFHRAEIMAALANGTTLVLIAAYIFYEAYQRFRNPPAVHTSIMLVVALVGLIANLITMRLLYPERHNNLNVRATFFHGERTTGEKNDENLIRTLCAK
jgi:cobalt-zinc-cadmium efflux system protein